MPCVRELRFVPPPWRWSAELRWILVRAFAPAGTEASRLDDPALAARQAQRLGLAERIACRNADAVLVAELGRGVAAGLVLARGRARAKARALLEVAGAVVDCAAAAGIPVAVLKGAALHLGGHVAPGARPTGDVDVLVSPADVRPLAERLQARGWTMPPADTGEHQLPPLVDAAGRSIDLHVYVPGIRLPNDGARFARFDALERAGLLEPASLSGGRVHVPHRDLMVGHLTVHAIVQHGFLPVSYPLTRAFADLCDLGVGAGDEAGAWRLITRDVGAGETAAVQRLCARLADGTLGVLDDLACPGRALLAHAVAGVFDDAYRLSLVVRALAYPLTEGRRTRALLRGVLRGVGRALRSPRERLALAPAIARAVLRRQ